MTLYTTGCSKCKVLKKKLDLCGVEYVTCTDVDVMIELGMTSLPVLEDQGKFMGFQEAYEYVTQLGGK